MTTPTNTPDVTGGWTEEKCRSEIRACVALCGGCDRDAQGGPCHTAEKAFLAGLALRDAEIEKWRNDAYENALKAEKWMAEATRQATERDKNFASLEQLRAENEKLIKSHEYWIALFQRSTSDRENEMAREIFALRQKSVKTNERVGSLIEAARVFQVLVDIAGASNNDWLSFQRFMEEKGSEFRFCGALGFGGKYWRERNAVTCYREDENKQRVAIMNKTNIALSELKQPFQTGNSFASKRESGESSGSGK